MNLFDGARVFADENARTSRGRCDAVPGVSWDIFVQRQRLARTARPQLKNLVYQPRRSAACGLCPCRLLGSYRQFAKNRDFTHPMREDVKRKQFSTLSVRPRSVLASRPLLLCGEDFGFNACSATEYDRDTERSCRSALSGFHAAVPTPFVAKLRKPTVGLSANHHPM